MRARRDHSYMARARWSFVIYVCAPSVFGFIAINTNTIIINHYTVSVHWAESRHIVKIQKLSENPSACECTWICMGFVRLHRTCIYSTEKRFSLFSGDSIIWEVATGACAVREFIMQSRHLCFIPLALDLHFVFMYDILLLLLLVPPAILYNYQALRKWNRLPIWSYDLFRSICDHRIEVNSLHSRGNGALMHSRSSRERASTFSAMEINIWMYF